MVDWDPLLYAQQIGSEVEGRRREAGCSGNNANPDRISLDWKSIPRRKPVKESNDQRENPGLTSIAVVAGLAVSQLNRDLPHQAPEELLRFQTCVVHDGLPYPVASFFSPSHDFVWPGSLLSVIPYISLLSTKVSLLGHNHLMM